MSYPVPLKGSFATEHVVAQPADDSTSAPPHPPRIPRQFELEQTDVGAVLARIMRPAAYAPSGREYLAGPNRFALSADDARIMAERGDIEIVPATRCRVLQPARVKCRTWLPEEIVGGFALVANDELEEAIATGIVQHVDDMQAGIRREAWRDPQVGTA